MNSGGEMREVEQRGRSERGARARRHAPLVTYVLSITLALLRAQLIVSIYYLRIREIAITSIDICHLFRLLLLRIFFLVCVIIKESFLSLPSFVINKFIN